MIQLYVCTYIIFDYSSLWVYSKPLLLVAYLSALLYLLLLSLKAILASKNLSLTTSQLLPHDPNLIDTSALALSHWLQP